MSRSLAGWLIASLATTAGCSLDFDEFTEDTNTPDVRFTEPDLGPPPDVGPLPDEGPMVVIFDGFGRLETEDDIVITLSNYAGQQVVHVRAATGTVSILAEAPAKEPEGVIEKGTLGSGSGLSLPSR